MDGIRLRRVIASNIRHFAGSQGTALNHLADEAGVARSQLYAVLAEKQSPTCDWLAKVSAVLEVEPWELLRPRSVGRRRG